MADRRSNRETPTNRANKASALRWAIGVCAVFLIGMVAWWMFEPRGEAPDLTPQHQPGYEDSGSNQPPAVVPNADTDNPPATPEPAGPGTE